VERIATLKGSNREAQCIRPLQGRCASLGSWSVGAAHGYYISRLRRENTALSQ